MQNADYALPRHIGVSDFGTYIIPNCGVLTEKKMSLSAVGLVTRQSDDHESPPPLVPLIVSGGPLILGVSHGDPGVDLERRAGLMALTNW